MHRTIAVVAVAFFFLPAVLGAQKRLSGTSQCGKPDTQQAVQAGDAPGHTFVLIQVRCPWPKPLELDGVAAKEDEVTVVQELTGSKATERGYVVGTFVNGDKVFVRTEGTGVVKDGAVQGSEGTWRYVGGTGKFKGVTGKGTYRYNGTTTQVEGQYRLMK